MQSALPTFFSRRLPTLPEVYPALALVAQSLGNFLEFLTLTLGFLMELKDILLVFYAVFKLLSEPCVVSGKSWYVSFVRLTFSCIIFL